MSTFDQGYACAVATMVNSHGWNTEHVEALQANGLTSVNKLKAAGVPPEDIKTLMPIIEEIDARFRRKIHK